MTAVDVSSGERSSDPQLRPFLHSGHLTVGALKRHKDRPVLFLGDTTLTGGELADRISQYIQAFEALGAGTGAAVGLLSLNRPEVLMIIGAGQTQGYRRTALHPLGSLDDHAYVLTDAEVTSLIIDPNPMFVERALGLVEKVPTLTQVLTIGPVPEEFAKAGVKAVDLSAEAAKYSPRPLTAAALPPDHIGGLTYTGGTTGKPKGVIGTTQSITTMTTVQLAEWEWPENPRFLMCTPLSHAGAAFFTPVIVKGGELIVLTKFDPAEVLRVIEEQKITATMLVPSMIYALMDHPDSHTRDLSSLETVYYGASAMNPVRLKEAIRRFGPIFAQYYGQSEAPMVITYLSKKEHDDKRLTSCGRPTLFAKVALLGEDGQPVPQGEVGEICVSGPLLSGGYWNLPEATAETFRDGWMHTGDLAREDEDGFYFIVDRTKDMIVTGGFNVFPREVEDVVAEHPSIAQVCVIGTPDEKWGEAVTAVVVLRPDADRSEAAVETMTVEIQASVKERKGSVHAPKQVIVVDSVPVTALGKPDKKAVRARFWEGAGRSIG
ncbi:fatty-acid--CoA ligase FadD8 [Mycolicibacterium austroafricanum]|jgi:fatty-acyl-CoA synthase|uniref:Fatty-acid--CoA ligase FadD8 n=1 Tax=Mycolicibacterium austroafricanum TaxID=39687 RepID=A0ABT8HI87_MYCAO|nr:fatty-acid--CoA ligase FadD8 [Mycolicibacterium austroafricanum]MDN4520479.1 fatty-acid--CoA ligase FadD8 [Mycolicibacterium austroafricanum]PQP44154.1 acyl-CoA synthetase [Mycolicibacterium austroafricanum]QRZ07649.1 AMP-binding protein [Mycolicibacterium austroafricanum]QZT60394.1 fatty-acid--CoA ligase FadD8 [Mycolicibacterium austroafricanum]QZT69312.1 fatty-acid--CoA ligase FadD8 [Mycolicibacterium austroafricanum]